MKFAHLSDIHIGVHHEAVLAELETQAFTSAMNKCIEKKVDFIIIAGDLFHSGIPDLTDVDNAVRKMREVREPTDGFSKEQLFKIRDILKELQCPQIVIVSHEKELENFADQVFKVTKSNGVSSVGG